TVFSSADNEVSDATQSGKLEMEQIKEFFIAVVETDHIKIQEEKQGDTEIRVISDKDATFRTKYMDAALGSLSFFEEHIGAYPHDQLDVIVIDADVGMEYPGIVTVMENVQTMDEVVAHEIGHQWFYGMVTNDAFHDPMVD